MASSPVAAAVGQGSAGPSSGATAAMGGAEAGREGQLPVAGAGALAGGGEAAAQPGVKFSSKLADQATYDLFAQLLLETQSAAAEGVKRELPAELVLSLDGCSFQKPGSYDTWHYAGKQYGEILVASVSQQEGGYEIRTRKGTKAEPAGKLVLPADRWDAVVDDAVERLLETGTGLHHLGGSALTQVEKAYSTIERLFGIPRKYVRGRVAQRQKEKGIARCAPACQC